MSEDRNEIRWRFQILAEMADTGMEAIVDQRKEMEEYTILLIHEIEKIRNTFLTGIGFAIGLLVSLIVLGIFGKSYTWYVIIGIIAGGIIFVICNILSMKMFSKNEKILDELQASESNLYNMKKFILAKALDENITKEKVSLLVNFVDILLKITKYNFDLLHYKTFKSEKPDDAEYHQTYEIAKSNRDAFSILNLKSQMLVIESFIKNFETEHMANPIKNKVIKL